MNAEINAERTLEQIAELRERFVRGGAYGDHVEVIDAWRRRFKKIMARLALKNEQGVRMLIERSVKAVGDIDTLLTTDRELKDFERAVLFAKKDYHREFLSFFDEAAVEAAQIAASVEENAESGGLTPGN